MNVRLTEIINMLPVTEVVGSTDREIRNIVRAADNSFQDDDLLWVSDKNAPLLASISSGNVICSTNMARDHFNNRCTYLVVKNPRLYFLNVVKFFFMEKEPPGISAKSSIDPTVKVGKNVTIRDGVVIEKNCVIGDGTSIDANTVIKRNTIIGNNVKIGANNTIGGEGFGYEKSEDGQFEFIPHIGNVVMEDGVEIGNNTTIDRAVIGSTILRQNVKVDNLVHIAHGVEIGQNSLVIANAMIAGSAIIGKNVWIAPSASVLNKLTVDDNAVIGMGAVVVKNVQAGQVVVGNPAKELPAKPKG